MHAPNPNDGYLKIILHFGNSLKVLVAQASGQITICVPPHSCRPIIGSVDKFRTSKCMHPIQMMDSFKKIFNLGVQLGF
jgi:hypothetical protein